MEEAGFLAMLGEMLRIVMLYNLLIIVYCSTDHRNTIWYLHWCWSPLSYEPILLSAEPGYRALNFSLADGLSKRL